MKRASSISSGRLRLFDCNDSVDDSHKWKGVGAKGGPRTAEHHPLNPRDCPTITTSLPISGETMGDILSRLHTSDVSQRSKINISLYFLHLVLLLDLDVQ